MELKPRFDTTETARALAGSPLEQPPPLNDYLKLLWDYWERDMDTNVSRGRSLKEALQGKLVMITGASSGIGRATALKVAAAGGIPLLVARNVEKLEEARAEIVAAGGTAYVYAADIADIDSIERLLERVLADHHRVDMLVNNAGRSIRRSISLSYERFHDFERTMQLNYFGAIKLIIGLLPRMRERGFGHVVNVSSIGVQTNPPRFSAYVASKAALDAFTRVVASEVIGDGVTFTTIHMPLVRTPMIAPTKMYDAFPAISPDEAADMICEAMRSRPKHMGTRLGHLRRDRLHALPERRRPAPAPRLPRVPRLGCLQGPEGRHRGARLLRAAGDGDVDEGRALVGVVATGPSPTGRPATERPCDDPRVSETAPAIEVRALRKRYGEYEAVRGVDISVRRGEVFGLLGPNGAGKTTIVEILEGYRTRTSGEVSVLGHDPAARSIDLRRRIGIVLQSGGIYGHITPREALRHWASFYARPRSVEEVLALAGLQAQGDVRVRRLSGRPAAAARPRARTRRRPRADLPGRADDGVRPRGPPRRVGGDLLAA